MPTARRPSPIEHPGETSVTPNAPGSALQTSAAAAALAAKKRDESTPHKVSPQRAPGSSDRPSSSQSDKVAGAGQTTRRTGSGVMAAAKPPSFAQIKKREAANAAAAKKELAPIEAPLATTASAAALASAAAISEAQMSSPQSLGIPDRKKILWLMCLLKIITSYDSGAYGAVLGIDDGIAQALELSVVDEGALGSAPFIGNTIGCAVAGVLFSRYEAKPVLLGGMVMHAVFTIIFALSPTFLVALVARTIIGFTLSFVVVYSVVWTDVFAPPANATTWLAAMNAGVPLGMLAGFIMGGWATPELELSWRLTFLFKAVILIPVLVSLFRAPPAHINDPGATDQHRKRKHEAELAKASGGEAAAMPTVCQSVSRNASTLLRNELFVCAVLGLVVLYFVVTAMQVFITSYLRGPPFYANMTTIVFGFGAASVTAPVAGVITGGLVLDKLGGYQTNLRRAAIFGAACGTGAAWFALLACYMTTVPTFIAALWCMLFIGAANVPVGTGVLMAAVPPAMRPTASSYAAVAFNVFGYFLGPIFCGYVADITGSLQQAFHIVLMMSGLGCIPLGLTVIFAAHHAAHGPPPAPGYDGDIPDPSLVGTPTVVEEHSVAMVMEGSFVVSVPTTPQRTPQRTPYPGASPFDFRRPMTPPVSMTLPPSAGGRPATPAATGR